MFKCLKRLLRHITGHYIMSPIKIKDGATAHLLIKRHPNIKHLIKPN